VKICFDKRQGALGDIYPWVLRWFITFGPFIVEDGDVIEVAEIKKSSIGVGQRTNPYLHIYVEFE
jgi:hypothetical protein